MTRCVWDGNVILHEWSELEVGPGAGSVEHLATWLFEEDSFALAAKLTAQGSYSVVADHLGTPLALYDGQGRECWQMQLDSYGAVRQGQGQAQNCPFRYQGQYEDTETGLYYNRFRYYDPETGQYISQDPIRLRGGEKLYAYAKSPCTSLAVFGMSSFYRGARGGKPVSFEPKDPVYDAKGKQISGDYQIDNASGKDKNPHGVSVFNNRESTASKGFDPHKIEPMSVSNKLAINQRRQDPRHFEIMPKEPMSISVEEYKIELSKIQTKTCE